MKENLKIRVITEKDRLEAHDLFKSIGCKGYCIRIGEGDFITPNMIEITLPELRELARPKEYLNDKFELVVTNQPLDGFILVPDGAEYLILVNDEKLVFRKDNLKWFTGTHSKWHESLYSSASEYIKDSNGNVKILWQRESKVETESKGRFLHQWAYEAFGRGEDVQIGGAHAFEYFDLNFQHSLSDFNNPAYRFRIKPQTIQIGSRTINKPISVKPENGQTYFIVDLMNKLKYRTNVWRGTDLDLYQFNSGLCHLTAVDAIAMTDALLELMK